LTFKSVLIEEHRIMIYGKLKRKALQRATIYPFDTYQEITSNLIVSVQLCNDDYFISNVIPFWMIFYFLMEWFQGLS
jgi:hypothetical protein